MSANCAAASGWTRAAESSAGLRTIIAALAATDVHAAAKRKHTLIEPIFDFGDEQSRPISGHPEEPRGQPCVRLLIRIWLEVWGALVYLRTRWAGCRGGPVERNRVTTRLRIATRLS
jgi:hypothetical protein